MGRIADRIADSKSHAKERTRLIDQLLEGMPIGKNALEIGCGAGHSSIHLATRYHLEVIGTDADQARIQTANSNIGNATGVRFQVADATSLPFEDSSFNLVLSQNVFHHIQDWQSVAHEVTRVLSENGLFVFSDMGSPGKLMQIFGGLEKDHGFHETEALVSIMEAAGFSVGKRISPNGETRQRFAFLFSS